MNREHTKIITQYSERKFFYTEEQLFNYAEFKHCDSCGGKVLSDMDGTYQCETCHKIFKDDFGKIRDYLKENASASIFEISQNTGVSLKTINNFIENCKLEIKQNPSTQYLKCNHCGSDITSGSICTSCGTKIVGTDFSNANNRLLMGRLGDKPVRMSNQKSDARQSKRKEMVSKLVIDLQEMQDKRQ